MSSLGGGGATRVIEGIDAPVSQLVEDGLLDRLPVAVVVTDAHDVVLAWNGRAVELYGYTEDEALGADVKDLILNPEDRGLDDRAEQLARTGRWEGDYRARRADGSLVDAYITLTTIHRPEHGFRGLVSAAIDNTERVRLQERLAHQALHDALTGLPNRVLVADRISHALARSRRGPGSVAVCFIDLDDFKLVNDTSGHHVGDDVLRAVGAALQGVVRPGDTVGRMSGDEFVVCCEDLHSPEEAIHIVERLRQALSAVSFSAGIAYSSGVGDTAESILRDADAAMYRAKQLGGGRHEVFGEAIRRSNARRVELTAGLHRALEQAELRLTFQPIVELASGALQGAEALLRWEHPVHGLLLPATFIDIAEQTNLILPIGRWVLEEAVRHAGAWRTGDGRTLSVAVNLSARQLDDPSFAAFVEDVLRRHGARPGDLCLELTESVFMDDDTGAAATLSAIRELGVRVAIDDFGTGYSSLAYLRRFPVDYLKIDRSFIADMTDDADDDVIVSSIIDLARSLGLETVAEGVETEAQRARLVEHGASFAQGYHWSVPLTPEGFVAYCAGA